MITQTKRNAIRQRIHARIRRKLAGTGERPRLNVYRSLNHIYAQVIDDQKGETLVSASSLAKLKTGGNVAGGQGDRQGGGREGREKGIKKVVFDRGGYLYHGRIKALADAAREAGWSSKSSEQFSVVSDQFVCSQWDLKKVLTTDD
jgi:large subunit ribosomal protein L18